MYEGNGQQLVSISQADLGLAYSDNSSEMLSGHTNPHNVGGRVSGLMSVETPVVEPKSSDEELSNFYTAVVQDSYLHGPLLTHHLEYSNSTEKGSVRNSGTAPAYGLIPVTAFTAVPTPMPTAGITPGRVGMGTGRVTENPYGDPSQHGSYRHHANSTHHQSSGERSGGTSETGGYRSTASQKRKIRIRLPSSSGNKKPNSSSGPCSPVPYYHHYHHHHHHHHHRKSPVSTVGSEMDEDCSPRQPLTPTDESSKKQNHSEIEKRRRDKMNTYIVELSGMVPMCSAMSRKLDKITVLRMAVQHMKTLQRSQVQSYTQGHYKPFITDEDLKHLTLQSAEGFLFVVGCDRGRFLYVSDSVSQVLNFSQSDLMDQSWFDIVHPKDVVKVKEQLSAFDFTSRETFIDFRTMLPVEGTVPQRVVRLCPGARRSFFCRMRCKPGSPIKEELGGTGWDLNRSRKYSIIHCTGYLKACVKSTKDESSERTSGEACNLTCLVAVGRILPSISHRSQSHKDRPVTFISRHAVDGKFIFVDQRATLVVGFLPQELLGISMYGYYHQDDIASLARTHKNVLGSHEALATKIYRFRSGDATYVSLQSTWKAFRNPWTRDIECVVASNSLVMSETGSGEQEPGGQCDYFGNSGELLRDVCDDYLHQPNSFVTVTNPSDESGQNIQQMIDEMEAGKIGQQIADESKMEASKFRLEHPLTPISRPDTDLSSQQLRSLGSPLRHSTSQDSSPPSSPHLLMNSVPPSAILDPGGRAGILAASSLTALDMEMSTPTRPMATTVVNTTSATNNEAITITNLMPVSLSSPCIQASRGLNPAERTALHVRAEEILYMMSENVLPDSPHQTQLSDGDGNDEAAMSVIMSLLEADAGLGGPVDFSGLPWPLP